MEADYAKNKRAYLCEAYERYYVSSILMTAVYVMSVTVVGSVGG